MLFHLFFYDTTAAERPVCTCSIAVKEIIKDFHCSGNFCDNYNYFYSLSSVAGESALWTSQLNNFYRMKLLTITFLDNCITLPHSKIIQFYI